MRKLAFALAAMLAVSLAAPAIAADYTPPPPPPTCEETYGIFHIFHCPHHGGR